MNPGNANFGNINPNNIPTKVKNQVINQNIYHSAYGDYKMCSTYGSIKYPYSNSCEPGPINNICKVLVINKHSLDVANTLCDHGICTLPLQKPIPVIMYPLGKLFNDINIDSRDGIIEENIILRTNYAFVIKKQTDLFNIKENNRVVVYSNPVTTIRDINYNPLKHDTIFRTGVTAVCFNRSEELITDNNNNKNNILSASDLLNFQMLIEAVFQAAIGSGSHDVLILTLFGKEFGIPIDDQIIIYNLCIMKYGHKLKGILIAIPPYESKEVFDHFDKNIINPIELTNDVEMKYKAKTMEQRISKGCQVSDTNKNNDNTNTNVNTMTMKMSQMTDSEKMHMLKKIIKKNKEEKKKTSKSNN